MSTSLIEGLTAEEKLELLKLLETRDRRRRENWLKHYHAYPKQKEFHRLGKTHRERLFMAGNQLGKCRTVDSTVRHPDGTTSTMGELWSRRAPFQVYAWTPLGVAVADVSHVVRKPAEECVEVLLSNGRTFKAALDHQVLTGAGYASLGRLLAFAPCLPACAPERDPSVRPEGDPHSSGTTQGSTDRCSPDSRLDDERLRAGEVVVRELPKREGGVRPHIRRVWPSDALSQPTRTSSGPSELDPPSSLGGRLRSWARSVAFLARAAYRHARSTTGTGRAAAPLLAASASLLRSAVAAVPGRWSKNVRALVSPFDDDSHIVAYRSVGVHDLYDMTVPRWANYIADGVVHHNTFSGAAEVAFHATGLYPDDWQGYRFARPIRAIVGSVSGELTRKGVQRLLVGPPEKREEWGTGAIPKTHLTGHSMKPGVPDAVASITVKNEFGGESVIQFNSYDQGREKWQADTVDLVWMDEEPPLDIYTEALTRTNTTGGPIFITFTPLLGMSQVVKRFLQEKPAGTATVNMTIDDVDHLTAEQKAAIIAAYPEHEREARARGIPMIGEGAVFPVAESMISVDPMPLPAHWPRICAMDFGVSHPAAFVAMAHDRDSDAVYVYDAWRMKGKSAGEQAMTIIGKGYQHLPWAWPHDGLQRDKGSGQVLIQQYRGFGINTLAERAQFEPTPDGKPGGNSVEAGLSLMLERMQTRRLRVFSHLKEWFEEMRMLHRKDGQVVKLDDDLMAATRYGLMMLRKARTLDEVDQKPKSLLINPLTAPSFEVFDPLSGY